MKKAFIIMQIGNPELDSICEKAIIPALIECSLVPKRVDKHNEGELLKSEIVKFIESSDIIVADLTNERPNCYLEVGYAMGLGKFKNLILAAREDHNHDSPNYRKDGPKIHFDLAGYEILFWSPNEIDNFKVELEKRVKRRIAAINSSKANGSSNVKLGAKIEQSTAYFLVNETDRHKPTGQVILKLELNISSNIPTTVRSISLESKSEPVLKFKWIDYPRSISTKNANFVGSRQKPLEIKCPNDKIRLEERDQAFVILYFQSERMSNPDVLNLLLKIEDVSGSKVEVGFSPDEIV